MDSEKTMSDDLISRQDVINAVLVSNFSACTVYGRSEEGMATAKELIRAIKDLPSVQPETCEGCKHLGKWENEVEYGYSSPCTCCKRRARDNYER